MIGGYVGALAAVLTWRIAARYGLAWAAIAVVGELVGLALIVGAQKAAKAAWRAAAAKGGAR